MAGSTRTVQTASGLIRGRSEGEVVVFRGIPYALPPIGEFRLAAPIPPSSWSGVRDADAFGPPAPQPGACRSTPGGGEGQDWLTVNVWTPDVDDGRRPVLVWIHGGGYWSGSSAMPVHDGARLAREHGIVVVTMNYRLGVEGFAWIEGAPLNRGVLDQLAALRWVRDNIEVFGGDSDRVTVAGQSAGAGSLASLLCLPASPELAQQAVLQSVPGSFFSVALAQEVALAIGAAAGCEPTRDAMSRLEPAALVAAAEAVTKQQHTHRRWGAAAQLPGIFAPVVEDPAFPDPWRVLGAGAAARIPLLIGHTRDEFRLFLALSGRLGALTDHDAAAAQALLAPTRGYRAAQPRLRGEHLAERIWSDRLFRMPTLALAEAHAAAGGPTFVYELTAALTLGGRAHGAPHSSDVPLVFGNFGPGPAGTGYANPPTPAVAELSDTMRAQWALFVQQGDPGWPRYTGDTRLTQVFDTHASTSRYPEEASRLLWADATFAPLVPQPGAGP